MGILIVCCVLLLKLLYCRIRVHSMCLMMISLSTKSMSKQNSFTLVHTYTHTYHIYINKRTHTHAYHIYKNAHTQHIHTNIVDSVYISQWICIYFLKAKQPHASHFYISFILLFTDVEQNIDQEDEDNGDNVRTWQWRDDWGNWRLYPDDLAEAIETQFLKKNAGSCLVNRQGSRYLIV